MDNKYDDSEVVSMLRRSVAGVRSPVPASVAMDIATDRARRRRARLAATVLVGIVSTGGVSVAASLAILDSRDRPSETTAFVASDDPGASGPSTTEQPPACGAGWADLIDLSRAKGAETALAAVRERVGSDFALNHPEVAGPTTRRVDVVDPWGRTGTYEVILAEGGWVVTAGEGCGAP